MKIIVARNDGSVSVMALLGDAAEAEHLAHDQLDVIVQAEIAQWPDDLRQSAVSWRAVSDEEIPEDRTFRGAWRAGSGYTGIEIDMDHCRAIWKDNMRVARAPKLAKLDLEFQRAMETGTSTKNIIARKQALRDVTKLPSIEAATSPDDLKSVWPDVLNG